MVRGRVAARGMVKVWIDGKSVCCEERDGTDIKSLKCHPQGKGGARSLTTQVAAGFGEVDGDNCRGQGKV